MFPVRRVKFQVASGCLLRWKQGRVGSEGGCEGAVDGKLSGAGEERGETNKCVAHRRRPTFPAKGSL